MKKTNKFLSILLATILILSLFPATLAHASDNTITFSAEADKVDAKAGDIVNVDICMSENSVVAALTLVVNYDNTALKIVDVKSKEAFGYEEFNTAYGENQLAYLTASANPKTVGGTLFTIQFEVLKDGCTEISLSVDELADVDLQPIPSATQSAKIHNFVDGTCAGCGEKSVKWKFDEETGTLTIYGFGDMDNYYDEENDALIERPWEEFCNDIKAIVIDDGIASVGDCAFLGCGNIETVSISDDVTSIGYRAFYDCKSLESITIPDSVTSIGISAFCNCASLESVIIPDSVATISAWTFGECDSLIDVTIPDSVISIGNHAFAWCDNLSSVIIGDSVTSIGDAAFLYCKSLTSVIIPDSITSIGSSAFMECKNLASVYVANISVWCNIEFGSSYANPLYYADNLYLNGEKVTDLVIPDDVTEIKDYVFYNYDSITNVTIGAGVREIGVYAFRECDNLTSVTIGNSVKRIDDYAFNSCYSLENVYYSGTSVQWKKISVGYHDDCITSARIHYNSTGADTHPFNPVVTPPTCTEQGYTTYVCDCGYSNGVVDNYVDATGHKYESEITTPATHLAEGLMTYTCHCGDSYTEAIEKIAEHNHETVVTPPTCTEQGFTTYTCECGDTYVADYVDATGHSYDSVVTPPTCTEAGYTTYTCTVCGDTYVDDETQATGHSYKEEITKPATHTENGVMTYTCDACGDGYTETINATGDHYHVPTVTEPTCTEGGYTTYTCVCGDTYIDDETPANGHDYSTVVTEPTCTETGYTTYTCTVCDDTYVDDEKSATGHSFSNGNCTVCGETDPDYYVFSVKTPSRTTIRNKDGIVLHTEIVGNQPDGSYIEWTSNNNNFGKTVMNDGESLQVIANNKGNTTFTVTLCDANGNELATDSVELYSDSGFFQKIGGFFRSLFGSTKIYDN